MFLCYEAVARTFIWDFLYSFNKGMNIQHERKNSSLNQTLFAKDLKCRQQHVSLLVITMFDFLLVEFFDRGVYRVLHINNLINVSVNCPPLTQYKRKFIAWLTYISNSHMVRARKSAASFSGGAFSSKRTSVTIKTTIGEEEIQNVIDTARSITLSFTSRLVRLSQPTDLSCLGCWRDRRLLVALTTFATITVLRAEMMRNGRIKYTAASIQLQIFLTKCL